MRKAQLAGVQELPGGPPRQLRRPAAFRPREAALALRRIRTVTHHRVANVQQVNPDLVRAAGLQLGAQKVGCPPPLQALEVGDGTATALDHRHALAVGRMPRKGGVHRESLLRQVAPRDGQVAAADTTLAQRVRQPSVSLVVLGDQQQPRRILVQAVHDPRAQHPADSREVIHLVEQRVYQSTRAVAGRRMHHHPCRLVQDQQVRVLVQDVEG